MRRPSIPKLKRSSAPKPSAPFVAKPKRKRPPLRILLLLIVAIVGVFFVLRACASDDEKEVRQTVERYGDATRDKDYQALCDELYATAIVEPLRNTGQACEVALRIGLGDVENPTLTVRSVNVDGDKAQVEVDSAAEGQRPSSDTITLIKEDDGWRISSLANEAPADPTP